MAKPPKVIRRLDAPKSPAVKHRDMLVRADERNKIAGELMRLVQRSVKCALDGPQPLPGLQLTDIDRGVDGVRLRVERATAQVSAKRTREHHELFVLQSTLVALAELCQNWSAAYEIMAGSGIGRPRAEKAVMAGVEAVFGTLKTPKAKKTVGRTPSLPITTHRLDLLVILLQKNNRVKTVRAACEAIATRSMVSAGTLPSAGWRRDNAVKKETARLESRLSRYRRQMKVRSPT